MERHGGSQAMMRLVSALLCALAVTGCTVTATPPPSLSASEPTGPSTGSSAPAVSGSAPASEPAPTPSPAIATPHPDASSLPQTWTRSADLIAIRGGPIVAAAPDGGFVAVVSDAHRALVTLRSRDGRAWSGLKAVSADACAPSDFCGLTPTGLASHGATMVMTGRDDVTGIAAVWTSPDARTWTRIRTLPDLHGGELSGLVSTPSGFAAIVNAMRSGSSEIGVAMGSADGASWSVSWLPATSNTQPRLAAVIATGTGYAAVGGAASVPTVWTSLDGRTWTAAPLPEAKNAGFGAGLVVRGGELWAFAPVSQWQPGANASRWVSSNGGVTWTPGGSGPPFNWLFGVISLAGGLVATGRPATSGATSGGPIWTSADGQAWTAAMIGGAPSRPTDGVNTVAESDGHVVAAGWTEIDSGTAAGDEADANGRLVFWAGDAPAPPTLASPEPTAQPTPTAAASATAWPVPHEAPDAEALLPRKVGDQPYVTASMLLPIERDLAGGDFCPVFCPGEVGGWARKLGVSSGLVAIGFAVPDVGQGSPPVTVLALRLPTAAGATPISDAKLEDAWVALHAVDGVGSRQDVTLELGGKRVRVILPGATLNRYIYAHDGTLYLVVPSSSDLPDITKPGPLVDEVFAALP